MQTPTLTIAAALALTCAAWTSVSAQAAGTARPTGTDPTATEYTLAQVAGKPLPVMVDKESHCEETVTAGTLTLSGENRWRLATVTSEVCGDRTDEDRDSDDGTYRTEGATIRFLDDDGDDSDRDRDLGKELDLDELQTGTIADDGTLTVRLADEKTTLVFRR